MGIWIVSATHEELDLIKSRLDAYRTSDQGPCTVYKTQSSGIFLAVTGIGLISTAASLGMIISSYSPVSIIMVGTCGVYPGFDLKPGDLIVPQEQAISEAGICVDSGIGDTSMLGLKSYEQALPFDSNLVEGLFEPALRICQTVTGKMLSVMGVSKNHAQVKLRGERFKPVAEDMEGFSLAFAGKAFQIPVAQVRAVSNRAGDRDKSNWNLSLASANAQLAVLEYLKDAF